MSQDRIWIRWQKLHITYVANLHILFRVAAKRMAKDKKFGFGGKKRGMKQNTKESADDISEYNKFRRPGGAGGGGFKKKLGKGASKRPGKETRNKNKNKKKK